MDLPNLFFSGGNGGARTWARRVGGTGCVCHLHLGFASVAPGLLFSLAIGAADVATGALGGDACRGGVAAGMAEACMARWISRRLAVNGGGGGER